MGARAGRSVAALVAGTLISFALVSPAIAVAPPSTPTLDLVSESLIANGRILNGIADPSTSVTLLADGRPVSSAAGVTSGGAYAVTAGSLPYGHFTLQVASQNASGTAFSAGVTAYNLGSTPAYNKYVLVDKSDMMLYLVRGGVVLQASPVAIGMPRTPTPTGTFRMDTTQKKKRWSPWGVRRVPLQRKIRGHWRPTSYYIHGTNDSSSIGTWASHGCVRMYNADILRLSRVTWHVIAVIRP